MKRCLIIAAFALFIALSAFLTPPFLSFFRLY